MKKFSAGSYIHGRKKVRRLFKWTPVIVTALISGVMLFDTLRPPVEAAVGGGERIAYYGNWDIYGNGYTLKDVHTTGAADRLTTLVYSFENINPTTLQCFQDVHPVGTSDDDPLAGDGGADAWADYQTAFSASKSVSGVADSPTQPLRGNFNQLKQLKQKHPHLKILLSIGGWTFSKYFANAAQPASRSAFVSSCVDMYIRGNLPQNVGGDTTGAGGSGVAKGIFDGIDIDWEFPGSDNGHTGNHVCPTAGYTSPDGYYCTDSDTNNYTALLTEFRNQLNAQGAADNKHYYLTAAVPSAGNDMAKIQTTQVAAKLDWAGIMSYDQHGAWENHTNFQAPLYPSDNDPDKATGFTVSQAVQRWLDSGVPANKLAMGVPFYWRGWSGVQPGTNNGLYQGATGPSPLYDYSKQAGTAQYRELLYANKMSNTKWDDTTKSPWIFDNGNFYTGDTPGSISIKGNYIRNKGLLGAMVYSLESDDGQASMLKSLVSGLNGGGSVPMPSPSTIKAMSRTAASSSGSATNADPINMVGGNYLINRREFSLPGKDAPISFSLAYNSAAASEPSTVGWGWNHSYRVAAISMEDGSVVVQNPDGRTDQYVPNGQGGYNAPQGMHDTLALVSGVFKVTHDDKSIFNFNAKGLLATYVSPNGNTQTLSYDVDDRLVSVTDPNNKRLTITYNETGGISKVTDPSGRSVFYTYDAIGNLTEAKNPAGEVTKYTYDINHRVTKVTDPRGNDVVINEYDDQGRVTKQTNGKGDIVTVSYIDGQTTFTNARGAQTVYFYDSSLRLTKVQNALGGSSTIIYDANGNVSQTTDELGHTATRTYDSNGNLMQITDAANGVQSFTYDTQNNLLTRTDQLGRITTYTYDAKGNITQKKDPLNNLTKFTYDAIGQMTAVTDPLNNLTGFVYDANGNHVTTTDPSNRNTYYGYDSIGRLTAVEDAQLEETDYTLDTMDRLTKATDPSGHASLIAYDADGNKTKVTDANGHATSFEYDGDNNLTKTTNALNKATLYTCDGAGNLTQKTDAKGRITTYVYDLLNRQTQTTDPLGNVSKVTYDAAGNVASRIDASNRTTTYLYDSLDRLIKTTYPDATIATNTYDAVGNLLTSVNAAGTTTYTYNANDRVLTKKDPHNAIVTYTYNALGSLSTVKYPDNKTVTYTYTPSNQLSTVVDWNNQTTSYLYNNNAQLATKIYPNTIKATYSYDANGNLSNLTYKKGTAAFTKYDYIRDNVGNITEEDETKSNGTHAYNDYTYDAANQLTMNDAPTDTYTYTYDDVGNMATSTNGFGSSTYTYNNANQLTAKTNSSRSFTYDPQGNQITDTGKTLGYNFDSQLKSYVNGSTTTNYTYDATGNRIDKTQTGTGATNYQYVNIGDNNVLQAKNLTAATNQYYLYGLDQISQGDSGSTSRQYFLTDGMGNTRFVTNNSGTTVTAYAFDPYGKQTSGSTTTSNYTFQDEQKDAESGLTFLRARYYDPTTGRFTSQDPLSGSLANPASQNGYNYANNDPVNLSDPSGMAAKSGTSGYNPSASQQMLDYFGISKIQQNIDTCNYGGLAMSTLATASMFDTGAGFGGTTRTLSTGMKVVKAEQAIVKSKDMARGVVSEARVLNDLGYAKNTQKFVGSEAASIPDISADIVGEIKDTKVVNLTKQMRTHVEAANVLTPGQKPVLYTGTNTHVSVNVNRAFDVIRRTDLGPR